MIDRAWLRLWSERVRSLGAHRLSAKPMQLCLPLIKGRVVAALLSYASGTTESRELVLRFGVGEGKAWQVRNQREKQGLTLAAAVLISWLGWVLLVNPALRGRAHWQRELPPQ